MKHFITVYSGTMFDLEHPTLEMINILDIAHHLSHVNRWAGATEDPYSVGQHSLLVCYLAPPELKQWALMHDAGEYVLGDDTRPKKQLIPELKVREHTVMRLVAEKFNLPWPEPPELKQYDDMALAIEEVNLMPNGPCHSDPKYWDLAKKYKRNVAPVRPKQVEAAFLIRFRELFGQQGLT